MGSSGGGKDEEGKANPVAWKDQGEQHSEKGSIPPELN